MHMRRVSKVGSTLPEHAWDQMLQLCHCWHSCRRLLWHILSEDSPGGVMPVPLPRSMKHDLFCMHDARQN